MSVSPAGESLDDVCSGLTSVASLLSILPLLFHSPEDQRRAYCLMNMYRRDRSSGLYRAMTPVVRRANVRIWGLGGHKREGRTRGDGNDRERGAEKLTSHRSAEIIRGDKQRRVLGKVEERLGEGSPHYGMQIVKIAGRCVKVTTGLYDPSSFYLLRGIISRGGIFTRNTWIPSCRSI